MESYIWFSRLNCDDSSNRNVHDSGGGCWGGGSHFNFFVWNVPRRSVMFLLQRHKRSTHISWLIKWNIGNLKLCKIHVSIMPSSAFRKVKNFLKTTVVESCCLWCRKGTLYCPLSMHVEALLAGGSKQRANQGSFFIINCAESGMPHLKTGYLIWDLHPIHASQTNKQSQARFNGTYLNTYGSPRPEHQHEDAISKMCPKLGLLSLTA